MKKTEVMDIVRSSMIKAPKDYEWKFTATPKDCEPDKFQLVISLVKKQ